MIRNISRTLSSLFTSSSLHFAFCLFIELPPDRFDRGGQSLPAILRLNNDHALVGKCLEYAPVDVGAILVADHNAEEEE